MTPSVSLTVVIVNWKVRELLRECLNSLKADSGFHWGTFEVIVVDNASGDGSIEMLRSEFGDVKIIANAENVGFGAANNQAFELGNAEIVILLNPDTVVLNGALRKLVDALISEPGAGAIGCRLLNRDGSLQRWTAGAFPHLRNVISHYFFLDRLLPRRLRPAPLYLDRDVSEPLAVDWVSGACMAIRRRAIRDFLFDRQYFLYAEDMELCHRLWTSGWTVRYDPRASIVHYQGASLQQQSAEIMLSSLRSPRDFFAASHGRTAVLIYDTTTTVGFLIRWIINSGAAVINPKVYRDRADSSWKYFKLARSVSSRR